MNVAHRVKNHLSDCLQLLEMTHSWNGVTLYENVAARQDFQCLQSFSVWANESLSPFDKFLLVSNETADFDDLNKHVIVLHYFYCLREWYRSCQKLKEISRANDTIRVPSLLGGLHRNGAFDQIQLPDNFELLELVLYKWPDFLDILLSVLRKEAGETAFLNHAVWIMLRFELLNNPFIKSRVVVPWLLLSESLVFIDFDWLFCVCCLNRFGCVLWHFNYIYD